MVRRVIDGKGSMQARYQSAKKTAETAIFAAMYCSHDTCKGNGFAESGRVRQDGLSDLRTSVAKEANQSTTGGTEITIQLF
jgi:hypothetical protein